MNKKLIDALVFLTALSAPLYLLRFSVFDIPTNILEILVIISFIAFILSEKINYQTIYQNNKIYFWGIILILIGLIISALVNKNYSSGFGIIKSWFVLPIIFGFIISVFAKSEKDIQKILSAVYLSSFIVSLISIIYLLERSLTYDFRLKAFYLSPNYLAMFLVPSVFIGLYFIAKNKGTEDKAIFYSLSLLFILASIYFTYSYGAWISIISGLAVYFWLKNGSTKPTPRFWPTFGAILLLALGLFFSQQKFTDFVKNTPRSSTASRIMIYKSSWKILKDNPIWGIGPGNFQNKYLEYQKYFPPYLESAVPQPHNLYLAFWMESGLIGLIGFLLIILFWLKNIFKIIRQKNSYSNLAAVLFSITTSILIYGLYDTPYWKNDLAFIFWIIFALGISAKRLNSKA